MEQLIAVGADQVWTDDTGAGAGLPLVLLHPGVGSSAIWDPVLAALSAHHRVIRFDMRGYGRSPLASQTYLPRHDLGAVLEHYDVARAHLVGNSSGGELALSLAVLEPDRVASVSLLMPGVSGYHWPDEPTDADFERLAGAGDVDGLVELMLSIWCRAGRSPDVVEQMRQASPGWASEQEYAQTDEPVWERLGEVGVPASLMIGGLDNPSLVECNEQMATLIPGCEVVRMPAVDHVPTLRVPEVVTELVLETVARAEAG